MTEKYYIGFNEVSHDEFSAAQREAEQEGNVIVESNRNDGFPEYDLRNGTVIRGDNKGAFNRIEDGEKKEEWQVGTINQWVQGEQSGEGQAVFFRPGR